MLSEKSRLRHWKQESEEIVFVTPVYTAYKERYVHPDLESPVNFYTLSPKDGVNVLACDQDSIHHPQAKILWVRQFRPAVKCATLEIPGGSIEADDPDPLVNAKRELLEEGDCEAPRWIPLGVTQGNAGLLRNHLHTYLALGTRSLGLGVKGDGREVFELEWLPFKDRYKGVLTGDAIHSSTMKALALLEAHLHEATPISRGF
jgi:ADP-ribose pyrophosphatase